MTDPTVAAQAEIAALRARIDELEGSTIWRLAAPVVGFINRLPGLRLVLWLLTGRVDRIREHMATRRLIRTILGSGLFDGAWYATQRPDLAAPGADLLLHYATKGRHEGLWPNPLFDPMHYAAQVPGLDQAAGLEHYIANGMREGLSPHPAFDPVHYVRGIPAAAPDPLAHYLQRGEGDPNPGFEGGWYREHYGIGSANPLLHCLQAKDGRETSGARLRALHRSQAKALGTHLPEAVWQTGRLAIGIVTYNTPPAMLGRVLRSVRVSARQAGVDPLVLLIDNGDDSSAALPSLAGIPPCWRVLPTLGNVGFGGGHNLLMQAGFADGAELYLALNPDAALHPAALGALLRMAHAAGGRALVQAMQFPAEHTVTYDPATFETPWISGACMLIPKTVHDAVGGFDDGFFMYCEDVDLSWRARAAGFAALTCPAALLFHPTTNRVADRATDQMFLNSGLRLAAKWGDEGFIERTRAQFAARGLPEPDISEIERMPMPPGIVDFEHEYAFAPGRW